MGRVAEIALHPVPYFFEYSGVVKSMFKKKLIILAESLASSHCKSYVVQEKQ